MRHLSTIPQAEAFVADVMRGLVRPQVVISTTFSGEYSFDTDVVTASVGRFADVVTIESGDATRVLEDAPLHVRVFGGAARVFFSDGHVGQLRYPENHTVDDLISDVPMSLSLPARRRDPEIVTARIVRSDAATGVLAQLPDGDYVRVEAEGVANAYEHFAAGDEVPGVLRDSNLIVPQLPFDPASLPHGCVTLGLVTQVTQRRTSISVHPGIDDVVLRRRDVFLDPTDDDHVDEIVAVGDVLHVGVFWEEGGLRLSLVEVDGAVTPPPTLFPGGQPWLAEDDTAEDTDDDSEGDVVEAPVALHESVPVDSALAAQVAEEHRVLLDEMRRLRVEFRDVHKGVTALHSVVARSGAAPQPVKKSPDEARITRLEHDLHAAERSLQELRQAKVAADRARAEAERRARALEARAAGPSRSERRAAWASGHEWIRHEVLLAWVDRVDASEKQRLPLGDFAVGPDFEADLEALTDDQFGKAMRAVVDAVTGRAAQIDGRELHRLRSSDAGGAPYVTRSEDGADAYRCAIERGTPSARRLHYWKLPDGSIELARVREHDAIGM